MACATSASGFARALPRHPRSILYAYLAVIAFLGLYAALRSPIVAFDNDLWYHLSHGRYLFEQGRIPDTSYFSFLSPSREWVDYYWLFQALVYPIFSTAGYYGLIALRALLFAGFLGLLGHYLLRDEHHLRRLVWMSFVFGLYLVHALDRFLMIRPHAVSYLFILLFIYIIEVKPGKAFLLPPLAVLWTNLHGVEYPVMVLITLAYSLEYFWKRLVRGESSPQGRRLVLALCLAMVATFATPHGFRLIRIPFTSTEYAAHYINELAQRSPGEFFAYHFSPHGFDQLTISNLLLLAAIFTVAYAGIRRRLRWSHLLLFLGGLVLLSKAVRLAHEFVLLILPLMKSDHLVASTSAKEGGRRLAPALLAVLVLATPLLSLYEKLPDLAESYPLSYRNLPHGLVRFLNHVEGEGPVMNNPNEGGYLQWALAPRYRIFMDLEIPFLFADRDLYELASAFFDAEALRKFLARYRPAFITAPLAAGGFPALIAAHPRYAPVFVDDTGVLYADRTRFAAVVERYELRFVDPYRLGTQRFSGLEEAALRGYFGELERMAAIDPHISSVNQATAIIDNLRGRHREALVRIDAVLEKDSQLARAHAIRADALMGMGDYALAARGYRKALRLSENEEERKAISRSLSVCHTRAEEFPAAYEALKQAVGEFNPEASYRDLYTLGVLAAASGEPEKAVEMFRYASWKVPPDEEEWRRRIEENLVALESGRRAR